VLTFHNDSASTGLNSAEDLLTPANVRVGLFGKLFTVPLDGQVYAQPLIDTGVTINPGPNTSLGVAGIYDVVFAATEHDSLYAIDARRTGGAILWKRSFLDTNNPANNTLGASAITTVSSADVSSNDISPEIGITGTPVIDPSTGTLYLVAKTKELIGGVPQVVQRLHAINISDGTDRIAPFLIGDTDGDTSIYVYGSGDGSVVDPYNGTGKPVVQFNALREHQRAALSLVNNVIYVAWASHGDNGPYHGWVVAWDVSHLSTSGWALKGVLNVTPNGGLGGIWQGSGHLAFEADGSAFYFETGNGSFETTLNADGFPINGDYGDSLVKAALDPTTSATYQNSNGWGLKIVDYFTPQNQQTLADTDLDFGSGGPLVLPDAVGIAGHSHLLVAGGKEGKLYLVDRDNLGKFDPQNDHVVNAVADTSGQLTVPVLLSGLFSTPAYFNGLIYAVSGLGPAKSFSVGADGALVTTSSNPNVFGYLPGSPTISAAGTTGGIVWLMDRDANEVHAYDAGNLATELWNSGQKSGGADAVGGVVKFAVPTVANGALYIGTDDSLVVYGLAVPPTPSVPTQPVPVAPTGAIQNATPTLAWNPAPGGASYDVWVDDNTTGQSQVVRQPSVIGTSLSLPTSLAPGHTYTWWVRASNDTGHSPWSNPLTFTVALLNTATPTGPLASIPNATPTFAWASVPGADHYDVWVDDLTIPQSQALRNTTVVGTSLIPTVPLTSGHNYEWWVRATSNNGDLSPWSEGTLFTVVPPAAPVLTGPSDSVATGHVTFAWSAVPGADFYDLWVDDVGRAQSQVLRNTNIAATSLTADLPLGHLYQWWVRGLSNNGVRGAWSTPLSFKIALATPTPASPSGPIVSAMPSYSWSAVPGADFYDLWIDDATTGQSPVLRYAAIPNTSLSSSGTLVPGHQYRWWVRAYVAGGDTSPWTSATLFNVVPLATPTPVGPLGTIASVMPTFSWSTVSGADFYDFWVDDMTSGQEQVLRNAHIAGGTFTPTTPLTAGHFYEWWVRAVSVDGDSSVWSAPQLFSPFGIVASFDVLSIRTLLSSGH
jgi:hypothetical protein